LDAALALCEEGAVLAAGEGAIGPLEGVALALEAELVAVGGPDVRRPALRRLAAAFEEQGLIAHHPRRLVVSVDRGSAAELDELGREDVADHLTVDQDHPGANGRVDDALFADDQGVARVDLTAELAVQHDGAVEGVLALDLGAFVDEGREVA